MDIERCSNSSCARPIKIVEIGGKMPGSKEPEEITCPHCGFTITRMSNGVFKTSVLTHEEEDLFNQNYPIN